MKFASLRDSHTRTLSRQQVECRPVGPGAFIPTGHRAAIAIGFVRVVTAKGGEMMKSTNESKRRAGVTTTTDASDVTKTDELEQRLLAFAEQLGRIAGTLTARTEGWMERQTLTAQIAGIRDGAAQLLERIAPAATEAPPPRAPASGKTTGRSGGVVDAPGKKHRKPLPADPRVKQATSQAAKMRTVKTMVKTNRRRGRG